MSWIPAAGGLRDPLSRTAPRSQATGTTFTFGKYDEAAAPSSTPAKGAICDEPVNKLRWWTEAGRDTATVTAMRNHDIEKFWQEAQQDLQGRVGAVVNAGAAQVNKQVGLGSSLKKSLQDAEPPGFAQSSGYKQDFCAAHQQVGRRAVVHSPQAKEAYEACKEQARRNKSVGRGTNLSLAQF